MARGHKKTSPNRLLAGVEATQPETGVATLSDSDPDQPPRPESGPDTRIEPDADGAPEPTFTHSRAGSETPHRHRDHHQPEPVDSVDQHTSDIDYAEFRAGDHHHVTTTRAQAQAEQTTVLPAVAPPQPGQLSFAAFANGTPAGVGVSGAAIPVAGIGGFAFQVGTVRRVIGDPGWGRVMRRFSRAAIWALPFGAACVAVTGMWGWPTATSVVAAAWPASWLLVNLLGLVLTVIGIIGLTALLAATTARRWAFTALVSMLLGAIALAPVLGLIGVARPAVARLRPHIGAEAANYLEDHFFHSTVGFSLAAGGLLFIAISWICLACAVLSCGVLNRTDGYLLISAVTLAVGGAYLGWQFLLVLGALVALACGMDLSWTAAKLKPDGTSPDDGV